MAEPRSTVARHPDRAAIELALAKRVPLRKLSAKYKITITALHRHRQRLMRDAPELFEKLIADNWSTTPQELEQLRIETAGGWLKAVRSDLVRAMVIRDQCISNNDLPGASAFTGHVRKYLQLLGQAVNELQQAGGSTYVQNNFYSSPDFWSYQTAILQALVSHPAARAAVLAAIDKLEADTSSKMLTVTGREVAA